MVMDTLAVPPSATWKGATTQLAAGGGPRCGGNGGGTASTGAGGFAHPAISPPRIRIDVSVGARTAILRKIQIDSMPVIAGGSERIA
jgi:hypothetical protein